MDISDFEGTTKFKFMIPLATILSWVGITVGLVYFPIAYHYFMLGVLVYGNFRLASMVMAMIVGHMKFTKILNKQLNPVFESDSEKLSLLNIMENNYAFVIPNYKE